ncbi:hypothetical protein VNO78_08323 [Psophocarpus tetragonolobus]|uniref:Uncharacterized protein n=1 Tax=Psophocarpus tetragonolobus TaxID=3891 RepID=A0AAN9SUR8_PSOTE
MIYFSMVSTYPHSYIILIVYVFMLFCIHIYIYLLRLFRRSPFNTFSIIFFQFIYRFINIILLVLMMFFRMYCYSDIKRKLYYICKLKTVERSEHCPMTSLCSGRMVVRIHPDLQ